MQQSIAHFIDHTILQPSTTASDIEKVCNEAVEYHFASVCVPPYYVQQAAQTLANTDVKVATVIGFPFGYSHYTAKVAEAKLAITDGAAELDAVMNIAAFKNGDIDYIKKEIEAITAVTAAQGITLKVIIESGILTNEQIIECCNVYKQYPVQFLKTSTGYAAAGASVQAVQTMRNHLPQSIQIKASGGIKTIEFAQELINAGATRLGCSASVAIVKGEQAGSGY